MGELIEGAMQQAAQLGRQFMTISIQELIVHASQALKANLMDRDRADRGPTGCARRRR
jgi:hypothetical protein